MRSTPPPAPDRRTPNIRVEDLAENKNLSEQQKIAEASRQFEAIMLRQILSEAQKPVITSEFTDNSTAAGIYQDFTTNALADSMSKAGTLWLGQGVRATVKPSRPQSQRPGKSGYLDGCPAFDRAQTP